MKTIAVSSLIVVSLALLGSPAQADSGSAELQFEASLSGAQEVSPPAPPGGVSTPTSAAIRITVNRDLSEAEIVLEVKDAVDVFAAHLHCGRAGANGPIVVPLFAGLSNGDEVLVTRPAATGRRGDRAPGAVHPGPGAGRFLRDLSGGRAAVRGQASDQHALRPALQR